MSAILPLVVFLITLVLQALFAGYEAGFISASPIRIRYLAEEEHSSRAKRLLHFMNRPDFVLTSLLIGTNLAVVIGTVTVASMVDRLGFSVLVHDIISTVIVAPVLLIFAEIMPKSVFRMHPNRLSLALLPVIQFFYAILAPVAVPITRATRALLRVKGTEGEFLSPFMSSLEDLRVLVDEGADGGAIEPEEQEMIHSIIDLQTTQANEIMVPRIHIEALPETATREELVRSFERTGWTRIPIYRDTVDTIVGVVRAHDLIMDEDPENPDIKRFIRDVMHVPDTIKVDDLFQVLKASKQHLAIVTDEYGGTDGLVTIEDILEEIFGEIHDEFDREESRIQKVGPGAYVIHALTPLDEVAEVIGMSITDDEVETLGGWVIHIAGFIPAPGQVITHGPFRITVLDGTPSRVVKLRLEMAQEPKGADGPRP
ncbi:MAG TPA: hemolysin family protein [Candidatus Hydrogenedentes bacterium]|nr:hemolysin family protein [Candidatus Hydrogenedentota bacterium]HPG65611.1 hemolysin family protein [Candidatus Hydrogenedentota bacterium]